MRALFGSVVLGAMLAQTASVWADGATAAEIPVPWGSSSRGPFGGPSWRPGHEHNVPAPRTGDDKIPLEASGLDGRRDSAAAIQQLILMVEQHALTDGGRGYGASAVATALDRIAMT